MATLAYGEQQRGSLVIASCSTMACLRDRSVTAMVDRRLPCDLDCSSPACQ